VSLTEKLVRNCLEKKEKFIKNYSKKFLSQKKLIRENQSPIAVSYKQIVVNRMVYNFIMIDC